MHVDRQMLREPAQRGAREVARRLLGRVEAERDRLTDPADVEALHDFRVALRRLRSWLRAWRDVLGDVSGKEERSALSKIADASGESRDLDVRIAWVHSALKSIRGQSRTEASQVLEELRRRERRADARLGRVLDREFAVAVDGVHHALQRDPSSAKREATFAAASAALVREGIGELGAAIVGVSDISERKEAHRARIAAKRLRYLLEPFDDDVAGVGRVLEELKAMQDVLGTLHDAQVFAEEIDSDVLCRRLRSRERRAFARIGQRWLHNDARPLLGRATEVAAAMRHASRTARRGRR